MAAFAAAVVLGAAAAQAEPVKIRMAWVVPVGNWASIVLEKKDLAKHIGKSYTLETLRFQGTPPMITAIANGEIELANLAYSTLPLAIQNAGMDDLRVIADEFQDGVEGYHTNDFAVLNDSPIKKIEDLKGKVVASNSAGSAVDIALRAMLKKHGLLANRDYTLVEAPFPTMRAMLAEKKVALISNVIPFSFNPELKQISRPLFTSQGRARHLAVHRLDSAQVLHRQESRSHGRFHGGHDADRALVPRSEEPREAAKIAAKITKSTPERFGWVFTKQDYYRDPNMLPNLDALQSNVDMTHELGFIKAKLDVREVHRSQPGAGSGQALEVSVTPAPLSR